MLSHTRGRVDELVLLKFHVEAQNIVDLRDPAVLFAAGVNLADAVAPWQDIVKTGGVCSVRKGDLIASSFSWCQGSQTTLLSR